jgi:hypothetical protein
MYSAYLSLSKQRDLGKAADANGENECFCTALRLSNRPSRGN